MNKPNYLELGLQHEQQHQELLLMDLLDGFSRNPLAPSYASHAPTPPAQGRSGQWLELESGLISIGVEPSDPEFHFDNETPRQRIWLDACALADRLGHQRGVRSLHCRWWLPPAPALDGRGLELGARKRLVMLPATGARMAWNSACAACNRVTPKPQCGI